MPPRDDFDRPHDRLFRYAFERPEIAAGELRALLPPDVVAALDFSTLRLEPGSLADPEFAQLETDLLRSRLRCDFRSPRGYNARVTSTQAASSPYRFYRDLARWWPLVSPVEDYKGEAAEFVRVLREAAPSASHVLELGSGGGHNAFYMKHAFRLTLSDLSAEMLALSRQLNPECEHHAGDMRNLRLGRPFDAVFVHDAIDYMHREADLAAVIATAFAHCRPGGVALFVPDQVRETYEPDTDCGGSDGVDGASVRFLEWSYDPDPSDTATTTEYAFVFREADGTVHSAHETHVSGLYTCATWLELLEAQGFSASMLVERTDEDRTPRRMFLGRRAHMTAVGR